MQTPTILRQLNRTLKVSRGSISKRFGAPSTQMSTASDSPKWRHRRVVSSFLCCGTPDTPEFRVSTFKRSSKVRVYTGQWAACSGSIEASDASPIRAALRELQEETGLREEQLVQLGGSQAGLSYQIKDEKLQTLWEVWPFLWQVRDGNGNIEVEPEEVRRRIVLDWEHDEMRFVTLDEMDNMNTVENLSRGAQAVLSSLASK